MSRHDASLPDAGKWAVVVAGMHRSGTSVCAEVLSELGVELPRTLIPADAHNPNGYFESRPIVALNEQLLAEAGSSWDDWREFSTDAVRTAMGRMVMSRLTIAVQLEFIDAPHALIKDPRIGRMCAVWKRLLERLHYRVMFVLPFRHPAAVVRSLDKRDGIPCGAGYLLWLRHVLDAERATRLERRLLIDYDALLRSPPAAVEEIASLLPAGVRRPRAALGSIARRVRPELPQSGRDSREIASPVVGEVYESYRNLHRGSTPGSAAMALDRVSARLATLAAWHCDRRADAQHAIETLATLAR